MNFFTRVYDAGFTIPNFASQPEYFENSKTQILNGKKLSEHFLKEASVLVAHKKVIPKLAVILVGDNPASQVYVKNKIKYFAKAGFLSESYFFSNTEGTVDKLLHLIAQLNDDQSTHGILIQLPLPAHCDQNIILNAIAPHKDVDGFLPTSLGALACGYFNSAMACTPFGVMALLKAYGVETSGRHAVVVGRSQIVGKPMSMMLLAANCTVTIAHSKTVNLQKICKMADILIVAAGRPEFISMDDVQPGAVVVDVGIHKIQGKLCGDVHKNVCQVASALSPVPGGVGPMTIAMLMVNTALSAWS